MKIRLSWLSYWLNSKVVPMSGFSVNVSKPRMALMCSNLEMVCYVSWLPICFVQSFLAILRLVSMLCCLNYIPALWLAILVVRSC